MKRTMFLAMAMFVGLALAPATGWSQDDFGDDEFGEPATTPEPAAAPAESGGTADAGAGHGLGVGAERTLSGLTGAAVFYDMPMFHVEGVLNFADTSTDVGGMSISTTTIGLAGRGWYHLSQGDSADLSVGGGLGFENISPDMGDSQTNFLIEAGAQVRAFLVSNVAFSASAGLGVSLGDSDTFVFAGDLWGSAGIAYFFP